MDAATVRSRLAGEGIDVTIHADGTLTAAVLKPREQTWSFWLETRVKALPGAVVVGPPRERLAFAALTHTEVRFVLGPMRADMVGSEAAGAAV